MRRRLMNLLLSLIAGLVGLMAWQSLVAICPPSTVCPPPPSGCVKSLSWSGPACSTDSPYCCQYWVQKFVYYGSSQICGSNSVCVEKTFTGSYKNYICPSNGTCTSAGSSGSGSGSG